MKRRIIRADALNWAIQEFQEGGDTIERGRYAGNIKQERWKAPQVFFPTLANAVERFLREEIGDAVPVGEGLQLEALLVAVTAAEERTIATVKQAADKLETSLLIGILQGRGYKVTDGQKGRTTYTEETVAGESS